MKDIQVKVKVNSQIEEGELTAAVPPSKKMNQDQTFTEDKLPTKTTTEESKKEVAPIVFQPPPATEELVKGKEKESREPAPAASNESGAAPVSKKQKKVNDDTNNLASKGLGIAEGQGRPAKAKSSFVPPQFNPGLGLGYAPGLPGQMPLLVPSFNHHMYGSYPWKAIHHSGGVGGAHHMYYPQTSAPDTTHRASMCGQAILQTVSTDSQTDAKMKDMVSHLLIQNKELLIQNKELMEKIGN